MSSAAPSRAKDIDAPCVRCDDSGVIYDGQTMIGREDIGSPCPDCREAWERFLGAGRLVSPNPTAEDKP